MKKVNARRELLSLLRGFFATPIITALSKNGIIEKILKKKKVALSDFKKANYNIKFLGSVFNYLSSLGLFKQNKKIYSITSLGLKVFKRRGSFHLLHSYRSFINNTDLLLKKKYVARCDRVENVIGSGLTNGKKFFPSAIDQIKKNKLDLIIDIACGNGEFIRNCSSIFPDIDYLAIDLSSKALSETKSMMKKMKKKLKIKYLQSDGLKVQNWGKYIKKNYGSKKKILISMWYLVHEISKNNKNNVIKFLNNIYQLFPNSEIIIGEILDIDPKILFTGKDISIMPEFLFFHEISGQGVLSKKDYEFIEKKIKFNTKNKVYFDYIDKSKKNPSALVWHLKGN